MGLDILDIDILNTFVDVIIRNWDLPSTSMESNVFRKYNHRECEWLSDAMRGHLTYCKQKSSQIFSIVQGFAQSMKDFAKDYVDRDINQCDLFRDPLIARIDQDIEKLTEIESHLADASSHPLKR